MFVQSELFCHPNSFLWEIIQHPEHNHAYVIAIAACLFWTALTFIVSSATKNYSQTDKLWSIVPFLYTWICICDTRTLLMAALATIWGVRLTYNFNRRGGYKWPLWSGDEDYRWNIIRKGEYLKILTNQVIWVLFNLTFISFYQHFLLLAIASPSLVAWSIANTSECSKTVYSPTLNAFDALATILFICFLLIETMADNQQFSFQKEKYRQMHSGESMKGDYQDGFCQTGLFSIVRKPNYAAEQCIWIVYYIFSVAASGGKMFFNWSIVGCILLVLLFQGSGKFTESITVKKYPKYIEYQQSVPLYVPSILCLIKRQKHD